MRKFLDAVDNWITDEPNALLTVLKAAVVLGVPLILIALGIAWGCTAYENRQGSYELPKTEWRCAHQHSETQWIPMSTGKVTTLVPIMQDVCDVYVSNSFQGGDYDSGNR